MTGTSIEKEELRKRLRSFARDCKLESVTDFKSLQQEEVVRRALEGKDVLAIMPTGAGKSLTYQFPAYLSSNLITLVVSPLKALMNQQATFPGAVALNSDKDFDQQQQVWVQLKQKKKFILLVSPEMLARQHKRLAKLPIGRFVVDEVHCLSDWGLDFRPQYWWVAHFLRCVERERGGGHIPRLLLTATANKHVLADIAHHFPEVEDKTTHVCAPLARPELVLSALEVNGRTARLNALVKFLKRQQTRDLPPNTPRRGIVFNLEAVSTKSDDDGLPNDGVDRLKANQVVAYLKKRGIKKAYAYASKGKDMDAAERKRTLSAFEAASPRKGQVTVVVATTAFGMGMDFASVPFVSHLYPRPTVSEYWQQVGRAGRGMETGHAETLALCSKEDDRYALRFAKAPALDGLLNAFTVPLHGWLYAFKRA
ncbi:MAG: DEAD/DEAH box helicase, partial [Acidobacteriaceae bacterium]